MRRAQAGFSIVEVLVALLITGITVTFVSNGLISSMRSDASSRARTSVNTITESWMDRYRANQEPFDAEGSVCTDASGGTTFTCTYPTGLDYGRDGVYSHSASAAAMNARFSAYRTVVTGTRLQKGTSRELWQLRVQVQDERRKQTQEATTYVLR